MGYLYLFIASYLSCFAGWLVVHVQWELECTVVNWPKSCEKSNDVFSRSIVKHDDDKRRDRKESWHTGHLPFSSFSGHLPLLWPRPNPNHHERSPAWSVPVFTIASMSLLPSSRFPYSIYSLRCRGHQFSLPQWNTAFYKNVFANRCLFQYTYFYHSSSLYCIFYYSLCFFSSLYCVFSCSLFVLKVRMSPLFVKDLLSWLYLIYINQTVTAE